MHLTGVLALQTQGSYLLHRDKPADKLMIDSLFKCKHTLIANEEFEFTEYSYDLKLFRVNHATDTEKLSEIHMYLYCLSDPDSQFFVRFPIMFEHTPTLSTKINLISDQARHSLEKKQFRDLF